MIGYTIGYADWYTALYHRFTASFNGDLLRNFNNYVGWADVSNEEELGFWNERVVKYSQQVRIILEYLYVT